MCLGVIVVFCTVPLWAANTRLKLQGAKLSSDQYKELKHPKYNGLLRKLHCSLKKTAVHDLKS